MLNRIAMPLSQPASCLVRRAAVRTHTREHKQREACGIAKRERGIVGACRERARSIEHSVHVGRHASTGGQKRR